MKLPGLTRTTALRWWLNRRQDDIDQSVDDYVELSSSNPMTALPTLNSLIRAAGNGDDLALLGVWVVEELVQGHGPSWTRVVEGLRSRLRAKSADPERVPPAGETSVDLDSPGWLRPHGRTFGGSRS